MCPAGVGACIHGPDRGHLDYAFATAHAVLPAFEAGRVRAIAIGTAGRSPLLPELVTVAEAGLAGFAVSNWDAWHFPPGAAPAIIERMAAALRQVLGDAELRREFARRGMGVIANSGPAVLSASIRAGNPRWAPLERASGAAPEGLCQNPRSSARVLRPVGPRGLCHEPKKPEASARRLRAEKVIPRIAFREACDEPTRGQ